MNQILFLLMIASAVLSAHADEQSQLQTRSLWKLLNGTNINPKSETFLAVEKEVQSGDFESAAMLAARSPESSMVTSVIRKLFTPLAGREVNHNEPAGDFVLGWMVAAITDIPVSNMFLDDARYSNTNSTSLQANIDQIDSLLTFNVSDSQLRERINSNVITRYEQSYISDPESRIGVISSLQYGAAIFAGGTNRRPVKKIVEDFLCVDSIEQMMNFSLPDKWVGRDIPRAPGDDPMVYLNRCVGCHAGMDAVRGAFSGFDFSLENDQFLWTPGVQAKMNHNPDTFPPGHWVDDHSWEHNGWLPLAQLPREEKYYGPRPLMQMLVNSPQLYRCLVDRTRHVLCPLSQPSELTLSNLAYDFETKQNLTEMVASVAAGVCLME